MYNFEGLEEFVKRLLNELKKAKITVDGYEMDHVCYRVETETEYRDLFEQLSQIAELLVEAPVGGRLIATFKLYQSITVENRIVQVIELPMPKPNVYYKSGWEHAEFVIQEDLNEFAKKHAHIQWNLDGLSKSFNKDVAVDLDKNIDTRLTAKFHNMNLERVIEIEKQGL